MINNDLQQNKIFQNFYYSATNRESFFLEGVLKE